MESYPLTTRNIQQHANMSATSDNATIIATTLHITANFTTAFNNSNRSTGCCPTRNMENIIISVIFATIMLVGCLGNGFVTLVVLKNKDQVRNTTNLFILNLALADLLFLIFCIPFHAVTHFTTSGWIFGEILCKTAHFIQFCR